MRFQTRIICFVQKYHPINIPSPRAIAQITLYNPAMIIPKAVPTNQKSAKTLAIHFDSRGESLRISVLLK
jgi:hypothetical protein